MSETLIYPFPGGVHPPENKAQSTQRPIATMVLCKTYYLPLNQHAGTHAQPLVVVGEKVLKGQMLARAGSFVSAPVHAPTSGIITAIVPHNVPHPSGLTETCMVLESDGKDQWGDLAPLPDYQQCDAQTLIDRIYSAGVVGLGGAGFPAAVKMASRHEKKIHTLIVNGAECEPYITADDLLMRERANTIVSGIAVIDHLLSLDTVLIGIEDNKPEAIAAMEQACDGTPYTVVTVPTKYPSGDAQRLTYLLTGKEVPHDARSVEMGIACYNVGTLAAVHDAVIAGKPLISRITTLTGDALTHPQNVEVLIGTPVNELLTFAGLRSGALYNLVLGGPMMGFSLESLDVPVIKTSNCFIAATQEEFPPAPEAQPCIRCGLCAEVCPCELLPQQLFWHAQAENNEQLVHHNLFDCIECGACAFVCPSTIPLVQYYRASKDTIRLQAAKHDKSEVAKQRFEHRQARLAREQAEKEAHRKANAERAAKLKAERAANPEGKAQAPADDPVQAAIARAKAKKAAAAGATPSASKPALSPQQKDIKIKLSMAKAQLKKTERALVQAKAQAPESVHKRESTDKPASVDKRKRVDKLNADINMLQGQVASLQIAFDAQSSETRTPAKADDAKDAKKQTIERALAKATLRKAEKALTSVQAAGHDTTALMQQLAEAQQKLQALAEQPPSPAVKAPVPKKAPLSDAEKKLKIEHAMAKAAVKKLQRAMTQSEPTDAQALQSQLVIAEQKAQQAEHALQAHQRH